MASYQSIEAGTLLPRGFPLVKRADGAPITTGTVNYYLKALTGANAGKWWRKSDNSWQATEIANAMTYENADGNWSLALTASPFTDGIAYLEYPMESGALHVPNPRWLIAEYTPSADSNRRVDVGKVLGTAQTAGDLAALSVTIKAKTDNLPTDPADQSAVEAAITAAQGALTTLINALNDLSQADAQTAAAAALTAYAPLLAEDYTAPDNDGITAGAASAATAATQATQANTKAGSIQVVTDHLGTALEQDGATYRFTSNALEQAPTGTGGGEAEGDYTVTVTVTDSATDEPIPGAHVTIRTAAGTRWTSGSADTDGVFTTPANVGDYLVSVSPQAGHSGVADQAFTVDGDHEAVSVALAAIPATAVAAGTRTVRYILVGGVNGAAVEGVTISAKPKSNRKSSIAHALAQYQVLEVETNASGIADLTCITADQFEEGDGVYVFSAPGVPDIVTSIAAGEGVFVLQDETVTS